MLIPHDNPRHTTRRFVALLVVFGFLALAGWLS